MSFFLSWKRLQRMAQVFINTLATEAYISSEQGYRCCGLFCVGRPRFERRGLRWLVEARWLTLSPVSPCGDVIRFLFCLEIWLRPPSCLLFCALFLFLPGVIWFICNLWCLEYSSGLGVESPCVVCMPHISCACAICHSHSLSSHMSFTHRFTPHPEFCVLLGMFPLLSSF